MHDEPLRFVLLITMWRERPADARQPAVWRFSVEDAHTRERWGFATLEAVVAFLQARMREDREG